jgi:energy-coupling factor transport system ATP-binding protein
MMITIRDLTYRYPDQSRPALENVSLDVRDGEFLLLTGPSGAGKSTLLRTLSGLVPHFSGGTLVGQVRVNGRDPIAAGPQALSQVVGFVFQNPEAQMVLDEVESEIAFALENASIPTQDMRLRVEEALQLLELSGLRARSIRTLSGGEQQRVAIAAALALRPAILALDEPTSQLDPRAAAEVLDALRRLNEDLGLTIVLAEHRLERVLGYADRVVAMEQGRIQVEGDVPEVLDVLPQLPPVAKLARELELAPLPLTVKDGRRLLRSVEQRAPFAQKNGSPRGSSATTAGAPLLQARHLTFAYKGQPPILRDLDLDVCPGEAAVLMGQNGSGKTTLLRCLVGLLRAQAGDVLIEGQTTANRSVADICRRVGYLPQNPDDLLFAETVERELETTLHNHGTAVRHKTISALLSQLGLGEEAHAYPRDLSVGQRQRVALGAVTVTHPALLLLDEPTRGLDYASKQQLVKIWQGWLDAGMGLLLVTHDVELAAQIADRVLILADGQVICSGPAANVLGSSPVFAPQIARLFPRRRWLTVADALDGLRMGNGHKHDERITALEN